MNLTEFIDRANGFGCLAAQVIFNKDGASIEASYERGIGKLSLHVNCEPLDWQIDSAMQLGKALGKVLFTVEELTLDLDVGGMPLDWENTLDSMMWHELLLQFAGVKKLRIGSSLSVELSRALESVTLELLPELQELQVQPKIKHGSNLFSLFIETRKSVGRPVHLLGGGKRQQFVDHEPYHIGFIRPPNPGPNRPPPHGHVGVQNTSRGPHPYAYLNCAISVPISN